MLYLCFRMRSSDEEVFMAVVLTSFAMVFLVSIIVYAIVRYQSRLRIHLQEVNELKASYQEEIHKAQLEIQEETFRHISQEIHDNIGQILSLARLQLSTLKDTTLINRKIETSKQLIDQAIDDLRHLSKRLNTEYISRQTLTDSLQLQVSYIEKAGLYTTQLNVQGEAVLLQPDVKLILFRIVQEALNNALKHAQASHLSIWLTFTPKSVFIRVEDNGQGFDTSKSGLPDEQVKGVGTQSMQYRARLIGAQLTIQSKPGHGTVVELRYTLPYSR